MTNGDILITKEENENRNKEFNDIAHRYLKFTRFLHDLEEAKFNITSVKIYDQNRLPDVSIEIIHIAKRDHDLFKAWKEIIDKFKSCT